MSFIEKNWWWIFHKPSDFKPSADVVYRPTELKALANIRGDIFMHRSKLLKKRYIMKVWGYDIS